MQDGAMYKYFDKDQLKLLFVNKLTGLLVMV